MGLTHTKRVSVESARGRLVLGYTIDQIQDTRRSQQMQAIGATAGLMLVAILVSYLVARRITQPVHELTEAVSKVGHGDLTMQLVATSNDEIGQLSKGFNEMVSDLAHSQKSLEDANAELQAQALEAQQELQDARAV